MTVQEITKAYLADCKRFGCKVNLRGLLAYIYQVRAGYRAKWGRRG